MKYRPIIRYGMETCLFFGLPTIRFLRLQYSGTYDITIIWLFFWFGVTWEMDKE